MTDVTVAPAARDTRSAARRQGVLDGDVRQRADRHRRRPARTLTALGSPTTERTSDARSRREAARTADIDVDPRYGRWSPSARACARPPAAQRRPVVPPRVAASACRAGSSSWASDRRAPTTSCPSRAAALERRRVRFARTAPPPRGRRARAPTGITFDVLRRRSTTPRPTSSRRTREIVAALVAAAREHGEVVYAVPGSPAVAERTVALLRAERDGRGRAACPGVSFADLAWVRARRRPDGRRRARRRRRARSTTSSSPARCSSRSATTRSCSPT